MLTCSTACTSSCRTGRCLCRGGGNCLTRPLRLTISWWGGWRIRCLGLARCGTSERRSGFGCGRSGTNSRRSPMTKLSGAAAEARLAEAWGRVFSRDPGDQQIIHVLTRPTEYPTALASFSPFETWMRNGCKASDEVWRAFAEIAIPWPYIQNARRAAAAGIPNTRIFVVKRDQLETAPLWLQYLSEVHLPAIAGLAGETLYRVW